MRRALRPALFGALVVAALAASAIPAGAHPLGNFTVNQSVRLRPQVDRVAIDHLLDLAEIPTLQERRTADTDGDGRLDDAESAAMGTRLCAEAARGSRLVIDGSPINVDAVRRPVVSFLPGQAGLETLRVECSLTSGVWPGPAPWDVRYRNEAFGDRIGWRELFAEGDGTVLKESDVAAASPSELLVNYPPAELESPRDERTARLAVAPGGEAASRLVAGLPPGADGAAQRLLGFLSGDQAGWGVALAALAVSVGLGATHAIAPGHGKTLIAATMLGKDSRFAEAFTLGATVALTHTVGVLILAVIISSSSLLVPAQLYPLLAVFSGLLVLSVGLGLSLRVWKARRDGGAGGAGLLHGHGHHGHGHHGHGHDHDHGQDHEHDVAHDHPHESGTPAAGTPAPVMRRRNIIALGLAGGLVPAPSAIVVLLGALAFGQAFFGILLVLAYGVGMALTLVGAGWAVMHLRARASRRLNWFESKGAAIVPAVTALVLVGAGLVLTARGITGI